MPARVLDASAVEAWTFGESRAEEVDALRDDTELHAPLLLAFELTNIAREKCLDRPENSFAVRSALRTELSLAYHWEAVDHQAVLALALETNLTAYDASYLWLARRLGVPLVTFDERLARVAGTGS